MPMIAELLELQQSPAYMVFEVCVIEDEERKGPRLSSGGGLSLSLPHTIGLADDVVLFLYFSQHVVQKHWLGGVETSGEIKEHDSPSAGRILHLPATGETSVKQEEDGAPHSNDKQWKDSLMDSQWS